MTDIDLTGADQFELELGVQANELPGHDPVRASLWRLGRDLDRDAYFGSLPPCETTIVRSRWRWRANRVRARMVWRVGMVGWYARKSPKHERKSTWQH